MIPVTIADVRYTNMGFVVFLRGAEEQRMLPIFVGAPEAQAIVLMIEKIQVPRPMTHDLFKNVLDNLECRIKRVVICDLRDDVFYAKLYVDYNGLESGIDSRPSDAIALALRFSAPIYVAKSVMNVAGVIVKDDGTRTKQPGEQKILSPVEVFKQQIAKAVEEERYEDAAKLRDELKKLTQTN